MSIATLLFSYSSGLNSSLPNTTLLESCAERLPVSFPVAGQEQVFHELAQGFLRHFRAALIYGLATFGRLNTCGL